MYNKKDTTLKKHTEKKEKTMKTSSPER